MFGSNKKTIQKDGITIELEITSASVVNIKITDKKNRRIVIDAPPNNVEKTNISSAMPGGVYC